MFIEDTIYQYYDRNLEESIKEFLAENPDNSIEDLGLEEGARMCVFSEGGYEYLIEAEDGIIDTITNLMI